MADILPFKAKNLKEKHKGKTLCRSGFHKWKVEKANPFDSQQGRLVTVFKCTRCHKVKREYK